MDGKELWERLLCIVFPARCVLCGQVVEYDDLWCGACPLQMEEASPPLPRDAHYQGLICGFIYTGAVRNAVLALKNGKDIRTARFFSQRLAQILLAEGFSQSVQSIVPVPVKPGERQPDHAALLARQLGDILAIPVVEDALLRLPQSLAQHQLNEWDRRENALRSYQRGTQQVSGGVLLVDDVYTTGSTAAACAKRLLEHGAAAVYVATAAYVPQQQQSPQRAEHRDTSLV